jgi:hypothetical protein
VFAKPAYSLIFFFHSSIHLTAIKTNISSWKYFQNVFHLVPQFSVIDELHRVSNLEVPQIEISLFASNLNDSSLLHPLK